MFEVFGEYLVIAIRRKKCQNVYKTFIKTKLDLGEISLQSTKREAKQWCARRMTVASNTTIVRLAHRRASSAPWLHSTHCGCVRRNLLLRS